MSTVRVELGERSYDVAVENGSSRRPADFLGVSKPTRVLVISDENVAPLYGERVASSFSAVGICVESAAIPPGEEAKTLATVESLYERMLDAGLDRRSLVVALGGGVVGDVAGFAAATYMRGVACMQIPTTIVAQVDSSVGGKTGVDLPRGKNLVGAFHQPMAVVIDPETLETLPQRQVAAGLAEVVKHGVIADAAYFERLEALGGDLLRMDADTAGDIITRSVEIKADVVSRDEREGGLRAILNFGHTVGHAIEMLTGYTRYLHGEAVAVGMVAAANIAAVAGLCDDAIAGRIARLCSLLALPTDGEGTSADDVIEGLARDKKTVGGSPRFVLPRAIGRVEIVDDVADKALREGLARTGFAR